MSLSEAIQYIDDLIHILRIMKNTSSEKDVLANYITALNIAYTYIIKTSSEPNNSNTESPIENQITIDEAIANALDSND